jgi:hypothetical protein
MARRRPVPRKKDKEAYEKALYVYAEAAYAYDQNQTQSNRHAWQLAMLSLLEAYSRTSTGFHHLNPTIPFQWEPLHDLSRAMRTIIDGKDADLFHVDPSDRYDSMTIFAKEVAVAFVTLADSETARQERKKWVMENYGVSRSTLNEWIRLIKPSNISDNDFGPEGNFLHSTMADHYRENKLIARKRKR